MATNATKSSSLTHISQATLDESTQSVKTTVLVNGIPVNESNPLPIDATITVSSIQTTSTVKIEADGSVVGDSNPLPISGQVSVEELKVNGSPVSASNPIPVDITDLEVAIALDKNGDSVSVFQGESSPGVTIPWKVESNDLDIRPISHTSDSVQIGDGSELLLINEDGSINTVSVMNQAYVTANVTVNSSQIEAKAGSSRLANRKILSIHNNGPSVIYIGPSGVTTSSGRPLWPNQCIDMTIGNLGIFVISNSSDNSIIVQEMA